MPLPQPSVDSHFGLQNIPFGIFSTSSVSPRTATRYGDVVVDLSKLDQKFKILPSNAQGVFEQVGRYASSSLKRQED